MKMTTKEASKIMGVTELFVRESIRQGHINGAFCIKRKNRDTFYIDRDRFIEQFGKGEQR